MLVKNHSTREILHRGLVKNAILVKINRALMSGAQSFGANTREICSGRGVKTSRVLKFERTPDILS